MECRRADAMAYRRATVTGGAFATVVACPVLDAQLDRERRTGRTKQLHRIHYASLPDGAIVMIGTTAHAIRDGLMLGWSPGGYVSVMATPSGVADCLTPPTSLAALRGGYRPVWHPSAAITGIGNA